MEIRDRTIEFQRFTSSYNKRNKISNDTINKSLPKSEFQQKASIIAHEIADIATLLSKLAQLAKRKPVFNDNPIEITEMASLIKRKIYSIEQRMIELSKLSTVNNSGGHSKNVVNLLNTKMKNISGDFKTVLETRQKLEIANRDRWERINKDTNTDVNKQLLSYNNDNPFMSSLIQEQLDGHDQLTLPRQEDMLLLEEQNSNQTYLQERHRAVETIESTIQEVGNLFQQLAHMVQEQGETIQRIDANVEDIELNISGAQRELLKYFDNITNNRWFAAKIFAVLFVFFLAWVLIN